MRRLALWFLNIPLVWITFQYFVGANQWKSRMYPSVFRSRARSILVAHTIEKIPLPHSIFGGLSHSSAKNTVRQRDFGSLGTCTEEKILDFGCSMGNNTGDFLDFDYWGLDLDSAMIEAAKKRWAKHANVRFDSGDILKGYGKKNFFDHVLFACTGHHLTDEEIPKILDALLRTLRPGGEIHFFDPIKQPEKDGFVTRLIMNNDQGKNMRTREEYDAMFASYNVVEKKLFESPNNLIKLQDMLYIRVVRPISLRGTPR